MEDFEIDIDDIIESWRTTRKRVPRLNKLEFYLCASDYPLLKMEHCLMNDRAKLLMEKVRATAIGKNSILSDSKTYEALGRTHAFAPFKKRRV